ncbi:hypothetical protein TNCV_1847691 [Trichonephila clavipes]|nr:hypothetical protein TNCV_1847691 [Trichonephila clavipes]
MILLKPSRKQDEVPIVVEALGPGPVGPCLKTSPATPLLLGVSSARALESTHADVVDHLAVIILYREHFWLKFNQKNNQKVWFSKLHGIPKWPRGRAVADFRIVTGQDCLSKHLNTIGIVQSPLCKLCDFIEEVDTIHLARCRALNFEPMGSRHWKTRHKMCDL